MNICKKNYQGFTLIELLVVLVIIGITISLIAPDMYKSLQQSQVKNEIAKINQLVDLSKERSFFSANIIELAFKENELVISEFTSKKMVSDKKELKRVLSSFFNFEETVINIQYGHWIGADRVNLVASPDESLTALVLQEPSLLTD